MTTSVRIEVQDRSQVAEARRAAADVGALAGLGVNRASDLAIVVTELATNVLKHAEGGAMMFTRGDGAVHVIALDRGRGIENLAHCMADGYSTASTPGSGLGAISRLSNAMEVFSRPGQGTAIYARIDDQEKKATERSLGALRSTLHWGGWSTPLAGETLCGDAYAVRLSERGASVIVVDGLGHGHLAAEASKAALAVFARRGTESAPIVLSEIHEALRATRGAAVAIAEVDQADRVVRYCGIGNIVGAVISDAGVRRMVSQNGTAGMMQAKTTVFTYPWEPSSILVMHSDGLTAKWGLEPYPGLTTKHPALLAGVLYRDFTRGRDDATIIALCEVTP